MTDIGMKIKMACAHAGISQAELAKRLQVSPQSISHRLKVGRYTAAELEKVAEALGAKVDLIFSFPDRDI